ncbi:YycH family regulatory protein [Alkalicoccobacillus murimartini]|uniref:Regulatory protein YycH of two-component signal transduction system YycFG n=1 Tax=Alkalicoccobacillus murimartini TaxID=171685 RepID=A0ABT9YN92_9BACI|nr:two-component system activity regulator YycH [Alkalicoccobacillus murimartini]MDQ0209109.1 regulatory protein YycH of two-component signal transduction system YycFG [Alkalicoccobacillus murimartini]
MRVRGLYYDRMKTWLLVVLVILSLILTWKLWTYQPEIADQESEAVELNPIGEEKSIQDVIQPSKIVKHQFGETYMVLESDPLFKQIYDSLLQSDLQDMTAFAPIDVETGIEIIFPDRLPISMFTSLFSQNQEQDNLPLEGVDRVLIYEDSNGDGVKLQVYSSTENSSFEIGMNFSSNELEEFLAEDNAVPAMTVNEPDTTEFILDQQNIYVPTNSTEYMRGQYPTERVQANDFTQALFPDPDSVRSYRQSNGELTYTDGTRILNLRDNENFMTYRNSSSSSTSESSSTQTNSIPQSSYDYINGHYGWTNDYILSWWRETDDRELAVYRLYMNNLPVLNFKNNKDSMALSVEKTGTQTTRYDRPLLTLDSTPIDEMSMELQSGTDLVERLKTAKRLDFDQVRDVRVGYEMTDEDNQRGLVTLEPAWFVLAQNGWQRVPFTEGDTNELE